MRHRDGHGFAVAIPTDLPPHVALFSESASRAVVSVAAETRTHSWGRDTPGVPATRVGETGGPRVVIEGAIDALVSELTEIWETAIPRLLGEAV